MDRPENYLATMRLDSRHPDHLGVVRSRRCVRPAACLTGLRPRRAARDTRNEETAAILADVCLEVSVPSAIRIGDVDTLLITRFDRLVCNGMLALDRDPGFAIA